MVHVENPLNVHYFRNLLKSEREVLEGHCSQWREICKLQDAPQTVEGDILVAIGQAELLMRERFVQFSGLIDDCEFKRGEKETTCQDLQGFWDIVYFQVEDVKKKFLQLSDLKTNNWEVSKPKTPVEVKKKAPVVKLLNGPAKPKVFNKNASSGMRAHILAARQKLKDAAAPKQDGTQSVPGGIQTTIRKPSDDEDKENKTVAPSTPKGVKSPDKAVFDAGFFKVVTPVKKLAETTRQDRFFSPAHKEKVLSSAVLRERMQNSPIVHKDYSPCMRITRSMKAKGPGSKLSFN
ncbi:disks large-associated protein 5-like [Macrobrachium nipponense]|uniref:disks large-associated protein 5-like n=1 Tax=Macrobrachium nipponense TaxID=159736 RepID=UPI0030C8B9F8